MGYYISAKRGMFIEPKLVSRAKQVYHNSRESMTVAVVLKSHAEGKHIVGELNHGLHY
jgi:hypothetical protein